MQNYKQMSKQTQMVPFKWHLTMEPNKGVKQGNYIIEQDEHWRQCNKHNKQ